jgi:hypothetical protein
MRRCCASLLQVGGAGCRGAEMLVEEHVAQLRFCVVQLKAYIVRVVLCS